MNKAVVKYFVDVGLLISFLIGGITGFMKIPGFGIKNRFITLHDWSGIALVVLVLIHLILNFNWIVSMTKSFFRKQED